MFLSPSKCNIYRTHDPAYYGRHTLQVNKPTSEKDFSLDGNRPPSLRLGSLHKKEMFNSTAREDASPDLSCAISCIDDNGDTSIHRLTALRATNFSGCESPIKIFARMKARVSNQNTPFKSKVVHDLIPPNVNEFVRPEVNLEKMDVEQYPASVDDTDAFTISPPNSPGEYSESDGESDARLHGGHGGTKTIIQSVPAENAVSVQSDDGDGHTATDNSRVPQDGWCVLLERLPVMNSPVKIFAMMKKDERQPAASKLLCKTNKNKENVKAIEAFTDLPVDKTFNADDDDMDEACSQSLFATQAENVNSIGFPKFAKGKRGVSSPQTGTPVKSQCLDDSMLLGSPRLAIPQKQTSVLELKDNSEHNDPRTIEGIQLKNWVLKLSDSKLYVDGQRIDNKMPWHSNSIVQRIASNILKTVSGSTYILLGKMSTHLPSELPQWFLKKFLYGFPQMWKKYLNTYLESKGRSNTHELCMPSKRKKKGNETKKLVTPMCTYATPSESSAGDRQKVSRSGRLIKKPLEYWRGGRVVVDKDLNVTVLEDYSIVMPPTHTEADKMTPDHMTPDHSTKKPAVTLKETCPRMSNQDEDETRLIRKAKPHQRPRLHFPKDRTPSETQESSPFAFPQAQEEELPKGREKQRPLWRSSRRSASASPPIDHINAEMPSSCNEGEDQMKQRRRGRPPKNASTLLGETDQSVRWSYRSRRTSSVNRSSTEDLTSPHGPRGRRTSSVEQECSSNTKSRVRKRTTATTPTTAPMNSQSPPDVQQQIMGPPKSRPRRRGRKKNNATGVSSEDEISEKDNIPQKRKPRGKSGPQIKKTTEVVDNSKWTDQELQKLRKAISSLPKCSPTFWINVAMEVGTRSTEECQEQYSEQQPNVNFRTRQKKQPQASTEAVKEVPQITAKAGTIRRRQQVRNVLDHLPKDDHDDVFSSSPMQKRLKKLPTLSDGGNGNPLGQLTSPQTPRSSMVLGDKTPMCLHISPGMLPTINRNDNDKYLYHFQKKMKGKGRGLPVIAGKKQQKDQKNCFPSPSVKRTEKTCVAEDDSFVVWKMFSEKGAPSLSNEESEEEDHYFSDD